MLGENPNDYSTGIPAVEMFYQDLVGQPFAARDLRSLKLAAQESQTVSSIRQMGRVCGVGFSRS
jgi:hypothetical protein